MLSLVDKMLSNWLAVIMYDYMKDYAGSSLFVLFKAIKIQVGSFFMFFCMYVYVYIYLCKLFNKVSNRQDPREVSLPIIMHILPSDLSTDCLVQPFVRPL